MSLNAAIQGDVSARVIQNVSSEEASATIPLGCPVALGFSGTRDGISVVLPSSSAAKAHAFAFGVAMADIPAGKLGAQVQSYGFVRKAIVLLQTRTASTESWSAATLSQGVMLNVDTVNNAFSTSGGTLAKTSYLPFAVLAESTAFVASASTTADSRTALTGYMKAFVRML